MRCECLMFQIASFNFRWALPSVESVERESAQALMSAKAAVRLEREVSDWKALRVPPLEVRDRVVARVGSAVRERRATARLPCVGEARMRAIPEAVVGPAPMRMARPEGGMVGGDEGREEGWGRGKWNGNGDGDDTACLGYVPRYASICGRRRDLDSDVGHDQRKRRGQRRVGSNEDDFRILVPWLALCLYLVMRLTRFWSTSDIEEGNAEIDWVLRYYRQKGG